MELPRGLSARSRLHRSDDLLGDEPRRRPSGDQRRGDDDVHAADRLVELGLLGGALAAGWVANALRYWQLVRLAGVAMRSVQRLREQVQQGK